MGNRLSNILRLSATALLLVAGVYGYICYEKTRIVWWLPVAAAAGGAVVTMPLLSRLWSRLTGLDDPGMNRLCHLLGIGAVLYFLFMAATACWRTRRRNTANRSPSRRKSAKCVISATGSATVRCRAGLTRSSTCGSSSPTACAGRYRCRPRSTTPAGRITPKLSPCGADSSDSL